MLRLRDIHGLIKGLTVFLGVIFFSSNLFAQGPGELTHGVTRYIFGPEADKELKMIITSVVMMGLIVVIATEKVHRTMVAMLGGGVLILLTHTLGNYFYLFDFITFDGAFIGENGGRPAVDYEVIGLLTGMMIVVGVLSETGLFEWLSLRIFQISKGNRLRLVVLFVLVTTFLSTFLNNVTTVIFMTPIALQIAKILKMNPLALVLPLIMASNIGGTATLIGDPPNILIGAAAHLSFNDFLITLALPTVFITLAVLIHFKIVYRKDLFVKEKAIDINAEVARLKHCCRVKHPKLLRTSIIILIAMIGLFFLQETFDMSPAVPALTGAAVLMFLRDRNILKRFKHHGKTKEGIYEDSIEEIEVGILKAFEKDVEWSVLAFFVFLFVCVGALENSGALELLAEFIGLNFGENLLLCAIVILWVAALASAFLDNIPFTIVMLPVVSDLIGISGPFGDTPGASLLWWALALGACLGGNGTLIGASSNIVSVGMMEKEGIKVSFMDFFKIGFPSMLIQIAVSTAAICTMYFVLEEKGIQVFG